MLKPLTKRKRLLSFVLGLIAILGLTVPRHAAAITFDFNSVVLTGTWTANSAIQTYMQSILPGVTISGAVATQTYNGEGYVVGGTFGGTVYSNTLGTSDGATGPVNGQRAPTAPYDTFIVNNTSLAPGTDTTTITIIFPSKIYSVSFDYEIFPNGSCPDGNTSNCLNTGSTKWPDFMFYADSNQVFQTFASDPQVNGWHSPNSGTGNVEKAPQYLGTTPIYFFPNGVTRLDFVDWPEMIGIDNLKVNVPEPASMILLGFGLIGLRAWASRRGRKEKR